MKLDKLDLTALYAKARDSYWQCSAGERDLFMEEIGEPPESIKPENDFVSIKFSGTDRNSYIIETRLNLRSSNGEVIGFYCIHEDENENVEDDFFVFK